MTTTEGFVNYSSLRNTYTNRDAGTQIAAAKNRFLYDQYVEGGKE